jgi:hypothetical protein
LATFTKASTSEGVALGHRLEVSSDPRFRGHLLAEFGG